MVPIIQNCNRLVVYSENCCAELTPHMFKEEQILFPYIVQLERSASDDLQLPLRRSAQSTIRAH
jgi:iron-sulfur cluster repair protein YtfE (RIC family)